jgi:hypothetical protein
MKTKWTLPLLLLLVMLASKLDAQDNIIDKLTRTDSTSKAKVILNQDPRITQLLLPEKNQARNVQQGTRSGFRVQVFSSNTQRTAKSEAFLIEKSLKETFTEETVYVSYTSPFWKVRIGDFTTKKEASEFLSKVIEAFPELKASTYTVKDQINIYR